MNNPRDGEFSVLSGYGLLLHDIFSGQGWRDALNVAEAAGGKTDVFFFR